MKIFDKATLKLTATYTAVIMAVSILFSACLGIVVTGELKRAVEVPSLFRELRVEKDFTKFYRSNANEVQSQVWGSLVLININMLIIAISLSYLLARWTLKPIERAMDDETRFTSDASHELRTPLATMRMENEILLRDKDAKKEDYRQQLQSNLEEIDKLKGLVDALLKLSGSAKLELGVVKSTDVVNTAIERIAKSAEAKNITINNQVRPFTMTTNEDALSEIIYIYLDNAVKYSPSGLTIEIFSDDKRQISVRDHGDGISDDDLPNIFNRFYRGDKSRNSDGLGLGLSLASRLAEQIGAKVSASNNSGKDASGATFAVKVK